MKTFCILLLTTIVVLAEGHLSAQDNDSKKEAFLRVRAMDQKAAEARQAERQAEAKREEAYKQAAEAVRDYIEKWEPSPTVANLRERFRLGTYLELAGDRFSAWNEYTRCLIHPKLSDREATWNGSRIADLIQARLEETAPTTFESPGCMVNGTWVAGATGECPPAPPVP